MATRSNEPDPRLEDIQERVDEIRRHLHDTPGMTARTKEDIPPQFEDEAFDLDEDYMGQAP